MRKALYLSGEGLPLMFEAIIEKFEPTDFLWNILEESKLSLSALAVILEDLSRDDLIKFQLEYRIAVLCIVPDQDIIVRLTNGEEYLPTYDHRIEYSDWVVSLGKEFYQGQISSAGPLEKYFKFIYEMGYFSDNASQKWNCDLSEDTEYTDSTEPHLIAYPVFEAKFDDDLWGIVDDMLE